MQCRRPRFEFWVGKIHWRRDRLPTPVFLYYPDGSAGKESTCNAGDLSSIPGLGRSTGEGKGYTLQYSGLENSIDCLIHGVAKRWTQLNNFHFHFNPEYSLEGLMLKHQYFGHLMPRAYSPEKTQKLRKIGGRRRRGDRR